MTNDKSQKNWLKFALYAIVFLLMVIWLGSYWLIIGIPVIYDIYISKKIHWAFWKKKGVDKQTKVVEWVDALIFAVVAATIIRMFFFEAYTIPTSSMEKSMLVGDYLFVSKVAYGPKVPNTPLSFPFTHHTLPLTQSTKSYLEWIKLPYKRLAGLTELKRRDVVVFNFPAGDTIIVGQENPDYYTRIRGLREQLQSNDMQKGLSIKTNKIYDNYAKKLLSERYQVRARPVDKRENFIKRCVAIPGDDISCVNGQLIINNKPQEKIDEMQFNYIVRTNGTSINPRKLDNLNIAEEDRIRSGANYLLPLTKEKIIALKKLSNITSIERINSPVGTHEDVFPFDKNLSWNRDNFGPIHIPKKGETININMKNISFYKRVINAYENHKLDIKDDIIYIDGKIAKEYTFEMNYYWMMGDNRHMSADSRYWGFVPEDHIVGKASFVWLSLNKDKSFPSNIRLDRFFKAIE